MESFLETQDEYSWELKNKIKSLNGFHQSIRKNDLKYLTDDIAPALTQLWSIDWARIKATLLVFQYVIP